MALGIPVFTGMTDKYASRLLKKSFFAGCSKMPRCKAPEILRPKEMSIEAYLAEYAAMTKDKGNAADGRFSAARQ